MDNETDSQSVSGVDIVTLLHRNKGKKAQSKLQLYLMADNYYCPLGKNVGNCRDCSFEGILPRYSFRAGVSFGK